MGVPASDTRFLRKVYLILVKEDPAIVSWDAAGRSFSIFNTALFQKLIKSKYHLSSLCTFRQNLYAHGFVEIDSTATGDVESRVDYTATPAPETYYHRLFVKGHPEYLERIPFDPHVKVRCQECKRYPSDTGTKCALLRRYMLPVTTSEMSGGAGKYNAAPVSDSLKDRSVDCAPLMLRIERKGDSLKAREVPSTQNSRALDHHGYNAESHKSVKSRSTIETASSNAPGTRRDFQQGGYLTMANILKNLPLSTAVSSGDHLTSEEHCVGDDASPMQDPFPRQFGPCTLHNSSFLGKLFSILETEDASIVSWTDNGKSFTVFDMPKFQHIIDNRYRLGSLCALRRNLQAHHFTVQECTSAQSSMNGEEREPHDMGPLAPVQVTYRHPFFVRDHPEYIKRINFNPSLIFQFPPISRNTKESTTSPLKNATLSRQQMTHPQSPILEQAISRSPAATPPTGIDTSFWLNNSLREESPREISNISLPTQKGPSDLVRLLLFMLLNEDASIINWNESGSSYMIHDSSAFEQTLRTKYQVSNMCTFRHYLRAHGFKEVIDVLHEGSGGHKTSEAYSHELFRADDIQKAYNIVYDDSMRLSLCPGCRAGSSCSARSSLATASTQERIPDDSHHDTADAQPVQQHRFGVCQEVDGPSKWCQDGNAHHTLCAEETREKEQGPISMRQTGPRLSDTVASHLSTRVVTEATADLTFLPSFQAPMNVTLRVGGRKRARSGATGLSLVLTNGARDNARWTSYESDRCDDGYASTRIRRQ
ncbi:Transcription factor skn7, partial [Globisporangium splendens]